MQKRSCGRILMICALVLLCLVVISTYMLGGIFAKYLRNGDIADSARVMKFGEISVYEPGISTTAAVGQNSFMITPGVPVAKEAAVRFEGAESETFVFLKVTAGGWTKGSDNYTFTAGPSNKLSWSIDNAWTYLSTTAGGNHVYYRELEPNAALAGTSGNVINNSQITVSSNLYHSELVALNEANLQINFEAFAVQANGFDSVSAAWLSLSNYD